MKDGLIILIDHRPRQHRDGSFDVIRVERVLDARGALVRRMEALVSNGWPTQRAARAAAATAQRMRGIAAP